MNPICAGCGEEIVPPSTSIPGYGIDKDGKKFCFACCGEKDRLEMEGADRFTLYLTKDAEGYAVSNWPGTMKFRARVHTGKHNFAGVVYFARFTDHTGAEWSGTTVGDMTQICHCRRLKRS
jgi:hypothetical protein